MTTELAVPNPRGSFNLNRFIQGQEEVYDRALAELLRGRKRTHWMWYIFPQIDGLGRSQMARQYAIKNRDEAGAYPVTKLATDSFENGRSTLILDHVMR